MGTTDVTLLRQYGALPFVVTDEGEIKVLLVTTRGRRGWIIPKGWPIRNLTAAATAVREAYEEAGLVGTVVGNDPIGYYRYEKRRHSRRVTIYEVAVFLLEVKRQLRKWPEKSERETRWFTPEDAAALVAPDGLAEILRTARHRLPAGSDKMAFHARMLSGRERRAMAAEPRDAGALP